jgi:lipoic acid synthetase
VRNACPTVGLEVLVSDFDGNEDALDTVLRAAPDVFNHNLETIPRLYPAVRPMADYKRSLGLLRAADRFADRPVTKSGLMLGLGETMYEILDTLDDLRQVGCDALTMGQYLAPSKHHHPVIRYLPPAEFDTLAAEAKARGFKGVVSGPYVRSSFNAEQLFRDCKAVQSLDSGNGSDVDA